MGRKPARPFEAGRANLSPGGEVSFVRGTSAAESFAPDGAGAGAVLDTGAAVQFGPSHGFVGSPAGMACETRGVSIVR